MTPTRTRKSVAHVRPRSEIVVAVAVSVGIVAATALLIWLMRPGGVGEVGTGGLFARQPRVVLYGVLTLGLLAGSIWWVLRGRHRPKQLPAAGAITATAVIVIVLAVVAAILWPGGLVHHWPARPKPITSTPVPPSATTPTTTPATRATTPTTKPSTATTAATPTT
ncbi:MAG TPA: hypothetical protein VN636_01175 [Acidimicrobiia bacterium]|nr:hypothetical protein [Acidimicrobiia bacterium]